VSRIEDLHTQACLHSLNQPAPPCTQVDASDVGGMMDALAACAAPVCAAADWAAGAPATAAAAAAAAAASIEPQGGGQQGIFAVVHVPGYGPYQHRMLVRQPRARSASSGEGLAAVAHLCVQLVCTQKGHTWLCVWVEGGGAAAMPVLQALRARLSSVAGFHVHVAPEQATDKRLWVLVPSVAVQQALEICAPGDGFAEC